VEVALFDDRGHDLAEQQSQGRGVECDDADIAQGEEPPCEERVHSTVADEGVGQLTAGNGKGADEEAVADGDDEHEPCTDGESDERAQWAARGQPVGGEDEGTPSDCRTEGDGEDPTRFERLGHPLWRSAISCTRWRRGNILIWVLN